MVENALRGGILQALAMVEVVVYRLFAEKLRTTFVVQRQVSQTPQVVPQGAGGLAVDGKLLSKVRKSS